MWAWDTFVTNLRFNALWAKSEASDLITSGERKKERFFVCMHGAVKYEHAHLTPKGTGDTFGVQGLRLSFTLLKHCKESYIDTTNLISS